MKSFSEILHNQEFSHSELSSFLLADGDELKLLFDRARAVKLENIGNKVYVRGLVEFSNRCAKDCYYCGIRKSNREVLRYDVSDDEIMEACRYSWLNRWGSVVLQSAENSTPAFVSRVASLLLKIKQLSRGELGITLSCGEQSVETYRRWYECGAHRYLLRIESSNRELYKKIHPDTQLHSFERRIEALNNLKSIGYQVGTGVMIGLPFQTTDDLVNDLVFFRKFDVDMVGMGPYVEHEQTPLYEYRNLLKTKQERLAMSLKMIAATRLLMPDINMVASTALEAIDLAGRDKALAIGANIVMPNITPLCYQEEYRLYENKPCGFAETDWLETDGREIGYGEWGDSKHFARRTGSIGM